MIAVRLTSPDLSRREVPGRSTAATEWENERSGILPTFIAQFQPLDPGIVNEAIPAFFIGRNKEGFWVARDVKGQIGGIFVLDAPGSRCDQATAPPRANAGAARRISAVYNTAPSEAPISHPQSPTLGITA